MKKRLCRRFLSVSVDNFLGYILSRIFLAGWGELEMYLLLIGTEKLPLV